MSNTNQTPATNTANAHASATPSRLWRLCRSAVVAFALWCCLVGLAAILGARLSYHTGKAHEIPKWNGWSYLIFSVKEFAVLGAILALPIAMIAFAISYHASRAKKET